MILTVLALMSAALTNPMPPPAPKADPCAVAGACRHVGEFNLTLEPGQVDRVKVDDDIPWIDEDGDILLFPGEMLVIRLETVDGEVRPVMVRAGRASDVDMASAESDLLKQFAKPLDPGDQDLFFMGEGSKVPPSEPGVIKLVFKQAAGQRDTMLLMLNGYDRWVDYQAVMVTPDGRQQSTTVCQVMDRRAGFEHWPHPIVMIRLSRFELVKAPSSVACD
ncbi:hypothetical protein QO010_003781 [Caulobacter ginsengisoli]|uniref:Uncharacterized protein n=1 Tax=Caulobacter ginsengisoli TaxID=400775 RepID=A0ABU0IXR8_9CAUL|nr:hypothetical protein [Caulobacter ginsengisoli]MDQ0465988.1 hypothetical protein [Caulobacter ginsengisoli]